MKVPDFFKDWWNWVMYSILIYLIVDLIKTIPTWVRWKWGYFSIDAIPDLIVLVCLFFANQVVFNHRLQKRVLELEKLNPKVKEGKW